MCHDIEFVPYSHCFVQYIRFLLSCGGVTYINGSALVIVSIGQLYPGVLSSKRIIKLSFTALELALSA